MAHDDSAIKFNTFLTSIRKANIRPWDFSGLHVKVWDRLCDFLLTDALKREFVFRSHDEYLKKGQQNCEVLLPTRPKFPVGLLVTSSAIRNEIWTRFSSALALKVVQVDYVLTRPSRLTPPQDLYCYFIESSPPEGEEGWPDDNGIHFSDCSSDHEWQQYPDKYPPIHELRISQLKLEVIEKVKIWLEIPPVEITQFPSPHLSFQWEWLARMEALKKVHFVCSVRMHPQVVFPNKWKSAWLNSPLLLGNMIHMVEQVRKGVEFNFKATELDHPGLD
jgi:hypothetical protein